MRFANPWYFLFLLALPLYWIFKYAVKSKKVGMSPTLLFSATDIFSKQKNRFAGLFDLISDIILSLALIFLIVALARPQGGHDITPQTSYGVDIVLAIDVSGSMLFVDKIPTNLPTQNYMGYKIYVDKMKTLENKNRLNTAKDVIWNYIEKQDYNRIGVVVFAGYSYTKCPLTLDKSMLQTILDEIEYNPDNDGTAIGMGIATSVNRLRKSEAKSKVIILLTDGVNNSGMVDPITAANIARDMEIRIYTIGLGNPEGALAPMNQERTQYYLEMEQGYDSDTLKEIATITGGRYFEAEDEEALQDIYDSIDELEKSKFEVQRRVMYTEMFLPYLIAGFVLLAAYIIFTHTVIKIP